MMPRSKWLRSATAGYPEVAQRGSAIVELTVVLVFLMVPLLMLMIEFGRLVQTYKTLVHQTNTTARYLSVQAPGQAYDKARCLFLSGQPVTDCDSTTYVLPGLVTTDFQLQMTDASLGGDHANWPLDSATGARRINLVTVSAKGYPYVFSFFDIFGLTSVTLPTVSATYRQVY
jgi:hypothetical protein